MERITIDTNIAIHGFKNNERALAILHASEIFLSFITPIELLSYAILNAGEELLIRKFISQCTVFHNSIELEETVIALRKQFKIKIPDAFIAATALYHKLTLISGDPIFKRIKELDFVFVEF